ncbi:hypothetical protein CBER1_01199 [Cercospora berteroae]|uniref:Uncharacterized protein n=1 Tax=Cercospora berteroae TaxID=357750 RepID=A0A2S6CIP1_9PEZI|nr:hypothetical protein CBER1_01199 [Cercospora berteroae]
MLARSTMGTTEMRIDRRPHPDLPWDTDNIFKHKYASSRSSWRPSWVARSSTSSKSQRSSSSTSRSDSISTRPASATNVYRLPDVSHGEPKDSNLVPSNKSPTVPEMRYEFKDETFDFPLPTAKSCPEPNAVVDDASEHSSNVRSTAKSNEQRPSECDSLARHALPSGHDAQSQTSIGRGSIASRASTNTSRGFRASTDGAEIEMASEEHFGYWNASFAVRIPVEAALCGGFLLRVKISQRQTPAHAIASCDICPDTEVIQLSAVLARAASPAQVVRQLQSMKLACALVVLKTSLEAAQTPGIPLKVAEKLQRMGTEKTKRNRPLWPDMVKQLKKVPQDRLVLLMFLASIARRLQRAGVTIDGYEPAVYLLQSMWPSSWVVSDLSRLLVAHFEDFPGEFPTRLTAINYRLATGKRHNMLTAMEHQERVATEAALAGGRYLQLGLC